MEKQAFEPTGLIPRSIIRTVDRFVQQLLPGREKIALQEYRVSRYQILVSIKSLLTLILIPLLISSTIKALLFTPLVEHFWNNNQNEIFLNQYQEKRAFSEMHDFSEKMFFESLLIEPKSRPRIIETENLDRNVNPNKVFAFFTNSSFACKTCPNPLPPLGGLGVKQKFVPNKLESVIAPKSENLLFTKQQLQIEDLFSPSLQSTKQSFECTLPYQSNICIAKQSKSKELNFALAKPLQIEDLSGDGLAHKTFDKSKPLLFTPHTNLQFVKNEEAPNLALAKTHFINFENDKYQTLFQIKSLELAKSYNKQSILAITNLLGDFLTFFTVSLLFRIMRPELIILKSFLTESVYSLSDTTKSFLLILGMDLLVGFHSPRGWELLLEGFLRHIGLPENENFILLFVALFPVFLDTVFKYWIFRYLNKISPSTVVTYHSMIE